MAALGVEVGQGRAGRGPALATVVDHAPDVAQQDIVIVSDGGEARQGVRQGHGPFIASGARGGRPQPRRVRFPSSPPRLFLLTGLGHENFSPRLRRLRHRPCRHCPGPADQGLGSGRHRRGAHLADSRRLPHRRGRAAPVQPDLCVEHRRQLRPVRRRRRPLDSQRLLRTGRGRPGLVGDALGPQADDGRHRSGHGRRARQCL
ncbi:hypothetical protein D3C85_1296830 [compost metagenome]